MVVSIQIMHQLQMLVQAGPCLSQKKQLQRMLDFRNISEPVYIFYRTLTSNIRQRRGENVAINLPIFKDVNTPTPFREPLPASVVNLLTKQGKPIPASLPDFESAALEDHVYMDAMCFGMGCSCLQVTIQACSIEHGRRLYDHLTVMTPIMLALSAAAPIFRGYLVDVDARWKVIAGSVDDRTRQERGQEVYMHFFLNVHHSL